MFRDIFTNWHNILLIDPNPVLAFGASKNTWEDDKKKNKNKATAEHNTHTHRVNMEFQPTGAVEAWDILLVGHRSFSKLRKYYNGNTSSAIGWPTGLRAGWPIWPMVGMSACGYNGFAFWWYPAVCLVLFFILFFYFVLVAFVVQRGWDLFGTITMPFGGHFCFFVKSIIKHTEN